MKFKVGDVVKCVLKDNWDSEAVFGQTGTVVRVNTNEFEDQPYFVKFEKQGYWNITERAIELVITIPFNYLN